MSALSVAPPISRDTLPHAHDDDEKEDDDGEDDVDEEEDNDDEEEDSIGHALMRLG